MICLYQTIFWQILPRYSIISDFDVYEDRFLRKHNSKKFLIDDVFGDDAQFSNKT